MALLLPPDALTIPDGLSRPHFAIAWPCIAYNRTLADVSGTHVLGLQQASRKVALSARTKKQLQHLDTACAWRRHITSVRVHQFMGDLCFELQQAHKEQSAVKSASFTHSQKKEAGCTASGTKSTGFVTSVMNTGDFASAQHTPSAMKSASNIASVTKSAYFTASTTKDTGFTASAKKSCESKKSEMRNADFTPSEIKSAGFTASRETDFTLSDMKDAGYTASAVKSASQVAASSNRWRIRGKQTPPFMFYPSDDEVDEEKQSTVQTPTTWWSCAYPGCNYCVLSDDLLNSQKKWQHVQRHPIYP